MSHSDDARNADAPETIATPSGLTYIRRSDAEAAERELEHAFREALFPPMPRIADMEITAETMRRDVLISVFDETYSGPRHDHKFTDARMLEYGLAVAEVWGDATENPPAHKAIVSRVSDDALGDDPEWEGGESSDLERALSDSLAAYYRALTAAPDVGDELPEGISRPDYLLAEMLRGIGEEGASLAETLEKTARERFETNPYQTVFNWSAPGLCTYPPALAWALWVDKVKPLALAAPPRPAMVKGKASGDEYWKVNKSLGAISWGFSGMGNVDVDGDKYASAPAATRYLPRAHAVLPRGRRPSQQILGAAIYDEPGEVSLVSRAIGDTQALLGVDASKLALLFMATGAKFTKLPLGDLVKTVTPDGRRIRKRDIERVARALRDVRGLGLVLPDDTDIQLFDVRAPRSPERADKSQTIAWSYSHNFADVLRGGRCKGSKILRALSGEFLINYSAFMNFNGNQGVLMRHYLAACTVFNDSMSYGKTPAYAPQNAPAFTREEWAKQTNSLSQAAVDLIAEGATRARSVSKAQDLKQSDEALEELEAAGLIVLEGRPDSRRIIAPNEWQEAHRLFRAGGARARPR